MRKGPPDPDKPPDTEKSRRHDVLPAEPKLEAWPDFIGLDRKHEFEQGDDSWSADVAQAMQQCPKGDRCTAGGILEPSGTLAPPI